MAHYAYNLFVLMMSRGDVHWLKNKRKAVDGRGGYTDRVHSHQSKKMAGKRISRIMTAVRSALKKEGVYLEPEVLRKLEGAVTGRWYEIVITTNDSFASDLLTMAVDCSESVDGLTSVTDSKIESYVHGNVKVGEEHYDTSWRCDDWEESDDGYCVEPSFDSNDVFVVLKKVRSYVVHERQDSGYSFKHQIIIYAPKTQIAKIIKE